MLWGAVMIGMGFVKTYKQLYACRILLGLLEAGFFPSVVYLLSTWYTRCMFSNPPPSFLIGEGRRLTWDYR